MILSITLAACHKTERGVNDLTPEENAEFNQYMARRDDCLAQESAQVDDGSSDINAVVDMVMWKCGPLSRRVDSLLYDKFHVSLSSSYAFRMQSEENSRKQVTEAVLTNRKIRAGHDPNAALLHAAPMIVPPVRAMQQPAPQAIPESAAPVPSPVAPPMPMQMQPAPPSYPSRGAVQGW